MVNDYANIWTNAIHKRPSVRIYLVLELINGPGDLRVRVVAVDEGLVEADAQLVLHMTLVDVGQDAHHRLQQEDQQQRENVLQQNDHTNVLM